jgi:hypothetical protein
MNRTRRIISAAVVALAINAGVAPPSTSIAAERLSPEEVIQREGQVLISDGTYLFLFRKDGSFESVPVNSMSGRTITGRWRHPELTGDWVIEGRWGQINGWSDWDDFRRMAMRISGFEPTGETMRVGIPFTTPAPVPSEPVRLYKAYFTVEEIAKIAPPVGMATMTPDDLPPVRMQRLSATASGVLSLAEWQLHDREFVVRLGFAPAPTGAPEPPRPVTQVWLLRADGSVIPQAKPPDEVRSSGPVNRTRIYQYPPSAREEALSVIVRVGEDYFTDRMLR